MNSVESPPCCLQKPLANITRCLQGVPAFVVDLHIPLNVYCPMCFPIIKSFGTPEDFSPGAAVFQLGSYSG